MFPFTTYGLTVEKCLIMLVFRLFSELTSDSLSDVKCVILIKGVPATRTISKLKGFGCFAKPLFSLAAKAQI